MSNKKLDLRCFGPGLLSFFVNEFSANMLVDDILSKQVEKFSDSASSFGPQPQRDSGHISAQEYPPLPFLQ